jgi:transcriptional regulator with XRE-family HTH domain
MVETLDFPTLLRVRRAARRWSQERTAHAIGVTFYRIRRLESALERPTAAELDELARLFDVAPKSLKAAVAATEYRAGAVA